MITTEVLRLQTSSSPFFHIYIRLSFYTEIIFWLFRKQLSSVPLKELLLWQNFPQLLLHIAVWKNRAPRLHSSRNFTGYAVPLSALRLSFRGSTFFGNAQDFSWTDQHNEDQLQFNMKWPLTTAAKMRGRRTFMATEWAVVRYGKKEKKKKRIRVFLPLDLLLGLFRWYGKNNVVSTRKPYQNCT